MIRVSNGQTNLLSFLGLSGLTRDERTAVVAELQLLSSGLVLKFAVDNLKDNKDLQIWLALSDSPDPDNLAPYDFLKEKIPNFENRFLKELCKNFQEIKEVVEKK